MGLGINILRAFVVVLFVLFLLVLLNPSVESWFVSRWDSINDRMENVNRFLKDSHFDVPKEHRRPNCSMKEFYKKRTERSIHRVVQNNNKEQHGSVLMDGRNEDLTENLEWKDGVIRVE